MIGINQYLKKADLLVTDAGAIEVAKKDPHLGYMVMHISEDGFNEIMSIIPPGERFGSGLLHDAGYESLIVAPLAYRTYFLNKFAPLAPPPPPLKCPRCGSEEFDEVDCGPDGYHDDITYASEICKSCGLYHSGWTDKWLDDCKDWMEEDGCEEYTKED